MKKKCFIITPIGAEHSPTRKRVDQWEKQIYEPSLGNDFKIIRADQISAPGIITEQILDHIAHADLALIDYTELNPNVMYEAAIRHISHKPFIQIYPITLRLPFDISNLRAISYDPDDLQYPIKLCEKIKAAYLEMQDTGYKVPELLPLKFDLEKIVSDPVRFVEVLKQHLPLTPVKGTLLAQEPHISEVIDSPYDTSLGLNPNKVMCPKCGIVQTMPISLYWTALPAGVTRRYKCNHCGTEFKERTEPL
jgi:hypothetical protein